MDVRHVGRFFKALFAVTVAVLLLPFVVVYASLSGMLEVRRVARTRCPHCDEPLGTAAVKKARRRWSEEFSRLRAENPGVKLRVAVRWRVVCPTCGSTITVRPGARDASHPAS